MRYLRILRLFFRLGVLNELEYRANFFIQVFQSLLSLVVALGGIAVIFDHTTSVNGWRSQELLMVIGVYFLIGGLINTVIQPSLQRFMEDIRMGTLDFTLMKPIDAQLMISVRQMQIWKVIDILMGFVLMAISIVQLGAEVGLGDALGFAIALVSGGAIVYCFWLMLATTAFWFVRIENILVIFESMYEAGRWPVGIYPGWLRFMLTFFVPVAFAVTVPAEAVMGRLAQETLLIAVLLAIGLMVLSRWFWRVGLRNYTGASA